MLLNFIINLLIFAWYENFFLHSTFYIETFDTKSFFDGTHHRKRIIAVFNTSFIIVTLIIPLVKKVEKWWSSNGYFTADSKTFTIKTWVWEELYVTWKLNKNVGVWPHIYAYVNNPFLSKLEITNGVLL